jgi:hypothetical protein
LNLFFTPFALFCSQESGGLAGKLPALIHDRLIASLGINFWLLSQLTFLFLL